MTDEKVMAGLIVLQDPDLSLEGFSKIREMYSGDVTILANFLSKDFNLLKVWTVSSPNDVGSYSIEVNEIDPEVIFVVFQTSDVTSMWSSVYTASNGRPVVVWGYLPWRRIPHPIAYSEWRRSIGASAVLGSSGLLNNLNQPVLHVFGSPDDPKILGEFDTFGKAARVVRLLKQAKFGIVQSEVLASYVHELGPSVISYQGADLALEADSVNEIEAQVYLEDLMVQIPTGDVSRMALTSSARYSIGLQRLAAKNNLHLVGIEENPGKLIGMGVLARPCLISNFQMSDKPIFQPSQDVQAGLAHFILSKLCNHSPFFLSLWVWDKARNIVVGGHPGIQPVSTAQPGTMSIEQDWEWDNYAPGSSAQIQFVAHPGRVTLLQIRKSAEGWLALAATGMCLESDMWVKDMPHAILRLDSQIDRFLDETVRIGSDSHWVMAYSSVIPELQSLCDMLGIRLEVLR